MRHQPKPNSTPEPYPHLACTVWVATEASKFTTVSNEASLWMAPDGYLSKLTLCPVPSESKERGVRQSRPISSEQARPAAGHSSMGESSGQAGPGPDELPPAVREIQWHQVCVDVAMLSVKCKHLTLNVGWCRCEASRRWSGGSKLP